MMSLYVDPPPPCHQMSSFSKPPSPHGGDVICGWSLSKSKGQSPSQILLSWALQKGFSVIPKSTNPDHIKENITLEKALDDEEMKMLDNLEKGHKYCWNPERVS